MQRTCSAEGAPEFPTSDNDLRSKRKGWREEAEHIAEFLGDLSDTTEEGWCSDCLTQSTHRLVRSRTRFGTRQYVCVACGSPTGWCDVPKCDHFADRSEMPLGSRAVLC